MLSTNKNIKEIKKVTPNKDANKLCIEILTNKDKNVRFICEYDKYCEWMHENAVNYKDVFGDFIDEYFQGAKVEEAKEEELTEIIDKYGNLMPDDDLPSNATNKMVGSSVFDTDKVYYQAVPQHKYYFNPNRGYGFIVW